jgi:hypothetical protein
MKHLLLFLFALLFTAAVFSQNVDTATTYQPVNGIWQPVFRDVTTYNASCKASTTLYQVWVASSSSWADNQLTTYTYNTDNRVIQQTIRVWDTSTNSWANSQRYISTYNSNNIQDSILFQQWLIGAWQNYTLTIDFYNADNLEDTSTIESWTDTSWVNAWQSIFDYNQNKTIHEIFNYGWTYVGWERNTWDLYQYDTSSKQVAAIETFIWNTKFHPPCCPWQHWEPYSETNYTYTYNRDGTLAESFATQGSDSAKTTFHYSAACLLPLTLLSFTAALDGKAATLQWTTATEINTKNFIIQRSIDAMHFQNIGSVNAVGNSSQITSYSFADAGAFNEGANKLYYRLQMVDKDGKFTYSNIATVQIANGGLFVIYPNPVKDELLITGNASLNNARVRIFDPGGKVVYQQQISNMQPGTTKINVSGFSKGVYYLQLITGSDAQTAKFVKY